MLLLPESWDLEKDPGRPGTFVLAGLTLDGKKLDIADYRGKLVLVDFWATWCPPCREELPKIRAAYDKYHDQGFEVIAVSLDKDRAALENYVREHKLPWPQIFFDEKNMPLGGNPLARSATGSMAIPRTFLIDREGNLLDKDLRGDDYIREVGRNIDSAVRVFPIRLYLGLGVGLLLGALLAAALVQLPQRWVPLVGWRDSARLEGYDPFPAHTTKENDLMGANRTRHPRRIGSRLNRHRKEMNPPLSRRPSDAAAAKQPPAEGEARS